MIYCRECPHNFILYPTSHSYLPHSYRFYKEELAGETNNYIYNRANVAQKSVLDVLKDVVDDTMDAYVRVTEVLRGTDAYSPWRSFVNGYM